MKISKIVQKKTNILRIIEKTFINFVDAKVEQIEVE